MKTLVKLLAVGIALLGITLNAATTYTTVSTNLTGSGYKLLVTGASSISSITLTADTTNAPTVTFYDSPAATNNWTNSAYTSVTSYLTNLTKYYTNAESIIATNTLSNVVWTVSSTTAGASNNTYTVVGTYTTPAGSATATVGTWDFYRGITIHYDTNCTLAITYRKFQ